MRDRCRAYTKMIKITFVLFLNLIAITQKVGDEFVVSDVLEFGNDNATGFLENGLITPRRIEGTQIGGNAILFPGPQSVHHRQLRLFGATGIAAHETGAVGARRRNGQQLAFVDRVVGHFQ